ncbi:hypothetical protein LMJF_31_1600 [Leishmania major strain Friedlin]|uniref:Leucine-rich repeat protein n=1 Tax=Leishmania major TaxID=5664 RepID=Q4Q6A2_LEIMA|nr:hypothetical protein LMJF_31_1600 [Leishmania major strain Friedlin]CAG9579331.1 Leucine_Rich_repeat_-_putative [Leishmania major strain Friedlin]CAJ08348.1 hypothetical protein LMJF_31_1600 [Leishmania major strain Friedlin]|eukprot:XP_001685146.1 hypothetical protein LMJF_31_1600 [Leishmania major strain Friedlin]
MSCVSVDALVLISEHLPGQTGAWVSSSPRARRSREMSSQGLYLSFNWFKDAASSSSQRGRRSQLRCEINDVQGMRLCRWWLLRCSGAFRPAPSTACVAEATPPSGTARLRPPPKLSQYMECPLRVCCWGNRHASAALKNGTVSTIDIPRLNCSLGELLSLGRIECVGINGSALSPTPPEWLSCLAVARGTEKLSIKSATLPLNELLSFLYSSTATLRVVEIAGMALPRLQMFALASRIEELVLDSVTVHPHSVVAIGNAERQGNGQPPPPSNWVPLSDLASLQKLRRLDMTNCKGDFDCAGIARCCFLRSVHLSGCNVKDADVPHLAQLPCVEELLLSRTRITNVQALAAGKGLRIIQLSNAQVDSDGIDGLQTLPYLTRLDLSSTLVSDVNCLGQSQSLIYLNLAKTHVTSEGIAGLSRLLTLEHLMLNNNNIRDVSFLAESHSLKTLSLQSTLVDSAGLEGLGRLRTLQDLSLAHTRVTNVTKLQHCRNLWRLDLQGSFVDQAGIVGLERLPKLRVLVLSKTDVASLELILKSESLEQLEVKFSHVNERSAFFGVTKASALTDVTLTHCDVSDINNLGMCKELRLLNVWSSKVTSEGIAGLCDARSLQEVDLAETAVTDISPLLSCTKIQALILYRSSVRSLDGIGALQQLRRLDIAETSVSSIRSLSACQRLEILNLSNTAVDDDGFQGIGQAQSLKVVSMSFTAITQVGQLGQCSHLEELHAQSCPVTSEGLVGLERACCLVKLNLSYTKLQSGIQRLTNCRKLLKLNVKFTEVPYDEVAYVKRHLPSCRVMNDAAQRMAKDVTLLT